MTTCQHCERTIVPEDGGWIDPEATGDDSVWRECCDSHDTFIADHEPLDPWAGMAPEERCEECGQPDNCGDCDHEPLSPTEVQALLGAYRGPGVVRSGADLLPPRR